MGTEGRDGLSRSLPASAAGPIGPASPARRPLDWGGALVGSFASFAFGPGTGPVEWDFGSLYTDGVIHFVPEPATARLLAGGLAALRMGRRRARSIR